MKKNNWASRIAKCCLPAMLIGIFAIQQSCLDEVAPGNYYTFTGNTVASFLESEGYKENFTDFVKVLKRAGVWGEMRTYGTYTCFAPTNEGFKEYLAKKGVSSVDELTKEQCDTIALTHLCNHLFYCKDLVTGALPYPNLLDRYLVYTCDSSADATGKYKIVYRLNSQTTIIERDDSVQNGVVQIVDKVLSPSNKMLPDVMKEDPNISLFNKALLETGLADSLVAYIDATYPTPSYDSTSASKGVRYDTGFETNQIGIFPEKRYFKFTAFAETDSVFKAHGIETLDQLVAFVTPIYKESFPNSQYDENDYTDRNHPLNRFVAYHLLPEQLNYNEFNISQPELTGYYLEWANIDIEDFFETMMPHSIMRLSSPYIGGRFINRKGIASKAGFVRGIEIFDPNRPGAAGGELIDKSAINGVYHYIDDILLYDKTTREETLNTRMRIMCQTLSPDYINSGARGRLANATDKNAWTMGYLPGYCTNVEMSKETQAWVRYRNNTFTCFFGEEITVMGIFDITYKLPPVPFPGTYELRMYECTMKGQTLNGYSCDRGVVQIYLNGVPQGIPVDLRISQTDPEVTGDGEQVKKPTAGDEEAEALLRAKEKAMHSRGYMLAPDSYSAQGNINLRWDRDDCLRKIITTDYFDPEQDYYFRIREVLDNPAACCPFNMIELVPKSIYAGDIPEDSH